MIGGTSLALQINHRLSEDLDFCQWIPRYHVSHAIPQVHILEELNKRFSRVDENRIDFHQVNYVISEPPVRITFYQTALSKPIFKPVPLIGNISMADLSVLGGSKMYVITQRDPLRDYYDLFVLIKEGHLTIRQMIEQAQAISSKTTPKVLLELFNRFSFDGSRFKLSDLDKLEPRYSVNASDYVEFCHDVARHIQELYPNAIQVANSVQVLRTAEHLQRKIQNAEGILADAMLKITTIYQITPEDIEIMISVGPYDSDFGMIDTAVQELSEIELEEILILRTGSIRNLIYNFRNRYSISGKEFKRLNLIPGG